MKLIFNIEITFNIEEHLFDSTWNFGWMKFLFLDHDYDVDKERREN